MVARCRMFHTVANLASDGEGQFCECWRKTIATFVNCLCAADQGFFPLDWSRDFSPFFFEEAEVVSCDS